MDFPVSYMGERSAGLEIMGLSFGYPGRDILFNKFSCNIPGGKITAVFGESGCEKVRLEGLL